MTNRNPSRRSARRAAATAVALLGGVLITACQGTWKLSRVGAPAESAEARAAYDDSGIAETVRSTAPLADLPGTQFLFERPNAPTEGSSTQPPASAAERLLVYTAQVVLEVASEADAMQACIESATESGGFLAARAGSVITFRIPAARFETFLAAVRRLGRVVDESMQVADVTRVHRDTTIRLDNARRARERLIALLASAEKVEDVLAIEREVTRLTEVIEQAEAELRSLDDRVALSTVTVTFLSLSEPTSAASTDTGSRSSFRWLHAIGVPEVLRCF